MTAAERAPGRFVAGRVAEVKLTARCDQRCAFCKSPDDAANLVAVSALPALLPRLARRADLLTLSGGEATLVDGLPRHVALARRSGFDRVELQTNGMRLATGPGLDELVDAGLTNLLISLHAHEAGASDRLTGVPGGFARTVRTVERALDRGVQVSLCHVICAGNHLDLERYAAFVRRRFAGHPLQVVFTLAIPTYRVREDPGLMPRLSDVGGPLRAALARFRPAAAPWSARPGWTGRAAAAGRRLLDTLPDDRGERVAERLAQLATPPQRWRRGHRARVLGHCGLPICVLGDRAQYHDEARRRALAPARAELTHPRRCAPCVHRARCSGLWRVYLERFGADGVSPVRPRTGLGRGRTMVS